jgi:hypothetical protein
MTDRPRVGLPCGMLDAPTPVRMAAFALVGWIVLARVL